MTASGTGALSVGGGDAGVCPAIHARLGRRRAAAEAVVRAAADLLRRAMGAVTRAGRSRPTV